MRNFFLLFVVAVFVLVGPGGMAVGADSGLGQVDIGPYGAEDAGEHQDWIRGAFEKASGPAPILRFAPGVYYLSSAEGIVVPDGATVLMEGARFVFSEEMSDDGEAFWVKDASNITWKGGEIVGRRDVWDPGVNIAGIRIVGAVENVRIDSLICRELTSNGIGVFGESDENPIRNITLTQVETINCCNYY